MSLGEPTVPELIRTLSTKVDGVASHVLRVEQAVGSHVTQEQRAADNELISLKFAEINKDIVELTERWRTVVRVGWSAGLLPVIVAVVVFALTRGMS